MGQAADRARAKRAQEMVAKIKEREAEEERRNQARLDELAEEARLRREARAAEEDRRRAERDAKLIAQQDEAAAREERMAKVSAKQSWLKRGGEESTFEQEWPSMWVELLRSRTVDAERRHA